MFGQISLLLLLLLQLLLLPCIFAPGAHKFIGRNGRDLRTRCRPDEGCLGMNEDEVRLAAAMFNGYDEDRERISRCMASCYDPDSDCPACFARCVDRCLPEPR